MTISEYGWNEIREQLEHDLEVYYVKDAQTNRQREKDKQDTIDWIIGRMQEGPAPAGVRTKMPEFSWLFGSVLWETVSKVIRMRHPICAMCGERQTVEIHHIRPRYLRGAESDPRNLIWLCKECHDEIHRAVDKGIDEAIRGSMMFLKEDDS